MRCEPNIDSLPIGSVTRGPPQKQDFPAGSRTVPCHEEDSGAANAGRASRTRRSKRTSPCERSIVVRILPIGTLTPASQSLLTARTKDEAPPAIVWFTCASLTGLALAPQLPRSIFLCMLYSFEPGGTPFEARQDAAFPDCGKSTQGRITNEEEDPIRSDFAGWSTGDIIGLRAISDFAAAATPSLDGSGHAPGDAATSTNRRLLVHIERNPHASGGSS
jgi:hypothetical protein